MAETTPAIRYARSGDVHVAYQVVGDGPVDIVFVEGFVTNRHVVWEEPSYRRFIERLGSFARVILFDKRGMVSRTGSRPERSRSEWTTSAR